MSAADFAARLEAARRFTVPLAPGVVATLRQPTEHESSCLYLEAGPPAASQWMRWQRLLVEHALVGWEGLTESCFAPPATPTVPDPAADPSLPFDAALVPPLLDARPEWFKTLLAVLLARLAEARATREAAAGN
jgi:hypothetical protein